MKRRWIVLLLLFMTIGAAGYGFAREEAQKVQKTSSLKIQAVYLECESEEANPLLEDAVLEVNRAVEEHFAKMQKETGYVEAYHNLHVYTKEGKDADTYVTFVTYDMKIRGIYTEVPGLGKDSDPDYKIQGWLGILNDNEEQYLNISLTDKCTHTLYWISTHGTVSSAVG